MTGMQTYKQDIEKLLAEGNSIQIKPQGYSMYPVLVPGRDDAIIAPVSVSQKLKRGDVVLYRRWKADGAKDILVLHRIWKINSQGIFLVGDNQSELEGPLKKEQVIGIMTGLVRKGKQISVMNPLYKALTGIWLMLRPLRPVISKCAVNIKHVFQKKQG